MLKKTLIASETPKGREILRNCAVGLDKAGILDEKELQQVVHRAGELQKGIVELIKKLSVSNKYADEEVESSHGYLSGYEKPIPISDQTDILRGYWPNLNPDAALKYYHEVYPTLQFPDWVEGSFALIRPGFFSNQYGEEMEEVLKALKKAYDGRLINYLNDKLGSQYLQQSGRTLNAMARLTAQQSGSDIIIVPAQFGIRYPMGNGKHITTSVRRARVKFTDGEYGKGAKDVGTMLIANPNRLQHYDDLWIDCAGDEYRPGGTSDFCSAPFFRFRVDGVGFGADWVGRYCDVYGSASGFLPECPIS